MIRDANDSTGAKKAANKQILAIAIIGLGIVRSLFKYRAGETGADYLALALIGVGAAIYFTTRNKERKKRR